MADPPLGIPCSEKQCLCCILDPWKIVSLHRKLTLCPYIHKAKKLSETNFQPRKIGRKNLDEKILRQSALIMKMWQHSIFDNNQMKTDHRRGRRSIPPRLWFPGDVNCHLSAYDSDSDSDSDSDDHDDYDMMMMLLLVMIWLWVLLRGRRRHCPVVR